LTIETAIINAVNDISNNVPQGTVIAVINIESDYINLSNYIINELNSNLFNKRLFQIVPRNTINIEAAKIEFDFQMSDHVSESSQKLFGQSLGADTIITGMITRESVNSYRLIVNAIHLESFTYQTIYNSSIQYNRHLQTLISGSNDFYLNYTTGERIGMGGLNMFFGIGSISQKQQFGWAVAGLEAIGITLLTSGLFMNPNLEDYKRVDYYGNVYYVNHRQYVKEFETKQMLITTGAIVVGCGIVLGYIIPFFHNKPRKSPTLKQ
jgi:hypothetical protein